MTAATESTCLPAGLPAPGVTDLDRPYWTAAAEGSLLVQQCAACHTAQWPPEEICASCHSTERTWAASAGTGKVFSWTRIWHPVHASLQDACPYIVVVVALDDFPVLMIGNLMGPAGQTVEAGTPVRASFERHDGYGLVQWEPIRGERPSS